MLVLFGRGAFDAESARLSSQALAAYALGLAGIRAGQSAGPAFFARGDTSMPVKIGMGCVALNLCLNVAFMVPLAHIGPALATSMAAICNVRPGFILCRRGQLKPDWQLSGALLGMVGASLAMGVVLYLLKGCFSRNPRTAFSGSLRWRL